MQWNWLVANNKAWLSGKKLSANDHKYAVTRLTRGVSRECSDMKQRSWDRVNSVIEYMSEKHGIDRNRFIFQYGQAGDANSVMYRSAMPGEEGPANVAPPFPNLRRD